MKSFLKKIISAGCVIAVLFSLYTPVSMPVMAAGQPDVQINDYFYTVPRNFKVGDEVMIVGSTTNIGNAQAGQGWMNVTNMQGCTYGDGKNTISMNNQTTMQPGETVDISIPYVLVKDTKISFTLSRDCTGDSNVKNNKEIKVEIESQEKYVDLSVDGIRIEPTNFKKGDTVKVFGNVRNMGGKDMGYSTLEYTVSVNNVSTKTKRSTTILSDETQEILFGEIEAPDTAFEAVLHANSDEEVLENVYLNNKKSFKVGSYGETEQYVSSNTGVTSGGYVTMGYIDPVLKQLYARTDVGGAYIWNSDLETWSHINNSMYNMTTKESNQGVNGFTKIHGREDVMFILTGDFNGGKRGYPDTYHVARTMDGGKSWKSIFPGLAASTVREGTPLLLDQNDPNILYVATSYGTVYRTTNALDVSPKWEKVNLPGNTPGPIPSNDSYELTGTGCGSIAFDTSSTIDGHSKTIYISSVQDGIYRSTDGGKSFKLMEGSPLSVFTMKINSKGELICGTGLTGQGIRKWDGKEWTTIFNNDGTRMSRVAIHPENENIIAIGGHRELYLSTDGGANWKDMIGGATKICETGVSSFDEVWSSATVLEFDPENPNMLWRGLCRVDDIFAATPVWHVKSQGFEELCQTQVVAVSGKDYVLSNGMDGRMVVKDGATMFDQKTGRKQVLVNCVEGITMDYCVENPDFMVAFGGGGVFNLNPYNGSYTFDGGYTWTEMDRNLIPKKANGNPDSFYNSAVSSGYNENGNPTIVAAGNEGVWRTEDLGKSWTKVNIAVSKGLGWSWGLYRCLASDPFKNGTYLAYDMVTGNVLKSTDDGKNFVKVSQLQTSGMFLRALYGNEDHYMLAMGIDGVALTSDGGVTWKKAKMIDRAKLAGTGARMEGAQYDTLFVYGQIGEVWGYYMSTDFGETWERINCPSYTFTSDTHSIDGDKFRPGVLYVASYGRGIYALMPESEDFRPVNVVLDDAEEITVRDSVYKLTGSCIKDVPIELDVNGAKDAIELDGFSLRFEKNVSLNLGKNVITVSAKNAKTEDTETKIVNYDPNYIAITTDIESDITNQPEYVVTGFVNCDSAVTINGTEVELNGEFSFSGAVALDEGENTIVIRAVDSKGIVAEKSIYVTKDTSLPVITFENENGLETDKFHIQLTAKLNKDAFITLNGETQFYPAGDVSFNLMLESGTKDYTFDLQDSLGNVNQMKYPVTFNAPEGFLNDYSMVNVLFGTPTVDGQLSADEWNLDRIAYRMTSSAEGGSTNDYTYFGFRTDGTYLYFAAEVYDNAYFDHTGKTKETYYDRDNFEIMIDPEGNRGTSYDANDKQLRLHTDGRIYDCKKKVTIADATTAAKKTDTGWIIEAKIPLSAINLTYKAGNSFNVEVALNDCDDLEKGRQFTLGWCASDDAWENTSLFGTAIFE